MTIKPWEKSWKEHLKICTHGCKDTEKQRGIFYVGFDEGVDYQKQKAKCKCKWWANKEE